MKLTLVLMLVVLLTGKWYCNECSVVRKKQGIIKK
jgi:hypothetical protein